MSATRRQRLTGSRERTRVAPPASGKIHRAGIAAAGLDAQADFIGRRSAVLCDLDRTGKDSRCASVGRDTLRRAAADAADYFLDDLFFVFMFLSVWKFVKMDFHSLRWFRFRSPLSASGCHCAENISAPVAPSRFLAICSTPTPSEDIVPYRLVSIVCAPYIAGRSMNATISASCSMAPDSRRSDSRGVLSARSSTLRDNCDSRITGGVDLLCQQFCGAACLCYLPLTGRGTIACRSIEQLQIVDNDHTAPSPTLHCTALRAYRRH